MKQYLKNGVKLAAAALVCALPFLATESQAVPAFARQTGMVCTTCHIGQDNVPNFTRTARIFQMRGYMTPTIREKMGNDMRVVHTRVFSLDVIQLALVSDVRVVPN